jgi:hypothetical protein
MASLHSRVVLCMRDQLWRGGATVALIIAVTVWWLLIIGVVALTVPTPEVLEPFGFATVPTFAIPPTLAISGVVPGQSVRLSVPTEAAWLVATDWVTYDDYQRTLLGHADAVTVVLARPSWLSVLHGQAARVVDIVAGGALIELLEDPHAGLRVWIRAAISSHRSCLGARTTSAPAERPGRVGCMPMFTRSDRC